MVKALWALAKGAGLCPWCPVLRGKGLEMWRHLILCHEHDILHIRGIKSPRCGELTRA